MAPLEREGRGYTLQLQEMSKGFSSRTMRYVNSRSSRFNSPSEALDVGASTVTLRPPVPDISETTDTHTHTHIHTQTDRHTEYGYYSGLYPGSFIVYRGYSATGAIPPPV